MRLQIVRAVLIVANIAVLSLFLMRQVVGTSDREIPGIDPVPAPVGDCPNLIKTCIVGC